MKTHYNTIVLGCGGIGGAALYWISRRMGSEVLGIEQFKLFHGNGASQDYSRIIRHYYHKDCYAKLTPHTYAAWETVRQESGVQVVTKTGGVVIAYKFASFLGQVLSELALDGQTSHDIAAFTTRRPAILNPTAGAVYQYR